MVKRAPQGIVAIAFTHDDFANANQNDTVQISGDFHVTHCTNKRAVGKIIAIDKYSQKVTVELFGYSQTVDQIVGANPVVAGDFVKSTAQNTIQTAVAADVAAGLAWGIALEGNAANGNVTVLPF